MKKQRQIVRKTSERVVTEVTRYQVDEAKYYIKLRLYCPQVDELVLCDCKMGTREELEATWALFQDKAFEYSHRFFGPTFVESNERSGLTIDRGGRLCSPKTI